MSVFDEAVAMAELARARGAELEAELAAARQQLGELAELRTADLAKIAELQARIVGLEAELAACRDPEPEPPAGPLIGWWGGGRAIADMEELSGLLDGTLPAIMRSRGQEGQFNPVPSGWFLPESQEIVRRGILPSLQIQPKIGVGPQRVGVGVERILRGEWDERIVTGLADWRKIPAGLVVPEEDVSEANIQQAAVESQPFLADWDPATKRCRRPMTSSEYVQLLRYLDRMKRDAGVRNKVHVLVSLTHGKWNSRSSDQWSGATMTRLLQPLVNDGVIDGIAVDGYAGDKLQGGPGTYAWNEPAEIVSGARQVAADLGVPWSIMETGCQWKDPFGAARKAKWYRDLKAATADARYVVVNICREQDADRVDFRPWVPAGALGGFVDLMGGAA